jgi:cytoskeletal protein CcmA (bactofilin family)
MHHRRRFAVLIVPAVLVILLLALALRLPVTAQQNPIEAAWQRAQQAERYSFQAAIEQQNTPSASPLNAGRQQHSQSTHVTGTIERAAEQMDLTLQGVAGANGPVEVQINNNGAQARQNGGQWESIGQFEGIFAPGGDPLAFLATAHQVVPLGPIERNGVTLQRYQFQIDGLRFARMLKERMEAELNRKGELPVGVQVDLPRAYAEMSGHGELWVDSDGLPRRQTLELRFPEQNRTLRTANVAVDFTQYIVATARTEGGISRLLAGREGSLETSGTSVWILLTGVLMGISVSSVAQIGLILCTILIASVIARAARSRGRHLVVVLTALVAMLGGPLLQTSAVLAYTDRQGQQIAAQRASEQQAAEAEQLAAAQAARAHNPRVSPLQRQEEAGGRAQDRIVVASATLQNRASRPLPPTSGIPTLQQTTLPAFDTRACSIGHTTYAPDASGNADNDGLNDYEECLLGTDPFDADSDGDTISDGNEVAGFLVGTTRWYGDPLNADSNSDGITDAVEWNLNRDNQNLPDDSDADGTPDLFDLDNDGDQVPDRDDLSPFVNGNTRVFSNTSPLALSFSGSTLNKYLYVEFQLRTADPAHLRYGSTVLDWPEGDSEGQVQDVDGATFADVALAAGRSATAAEELGDMRLVPMLEISVPSEQELLPATDVLSNYNILLRDNPQGGKLAYVPLQTVSDRESGELLAFSGKMLYLPGEAWGADHEVRLVWLVQALVDECSARDDSGECTSYNLNQPDVVFSYQDSWYLTGLNVREDHGTNLAVIYEDPTVDSDTNEDDGLLGLLSVLDHTFIVGSDCATIAAERNCAAGAGDGQRDLVIVKGDPAATSETLFDAFDRTSSNNTGATTVQPWGIPNTLRVASNSYSHRDEALYNNSSQVVPDLLETAFSGSAPVTPTLFIAREERARTLNLEEQGGSSLSWNNNRLSMNLSTPPPGAASRQIETLAGLTVAAYAQDNLGEWAALSTEAYREELYRRYLDPANPDDADRLAKLLVVAALYQGLFNGFVNTVELDGRPAIPYRQPLSDAEIKEALQKMYTSPGGQGVEFAANYVLDQLLAGDELLRSLRRLQAQESLILLPDELDQLATQFKYQKAAQGLATTAKVVGAIGLGLAIVNVGVIIGLQFADGETKKVLTYINQALNLAVNAINLAVVVITTAQRVAQAAIEVGNLGLAARSVMSGVNISKAAVIGAAIGLVVSIAITWGVFIDAVVSNNIEPGSPAFGYLIATAFAATLVAVLLFVLSLTTVGAIIVALIGVIDALLVLLGVKFTITGWLVETLARAFYDFEYEQLVTISNSQLGNLDVRLVTPSLGLRADNQIIVAATISQTIAHIDPTALDEDSEIRRGLNNLIDPTSEQFTENKLKSTVLNSLISAVPGDEATNWATSVLKTVQYDSCDDGCGEEDLDLYQGITVQSPTSGPLALAAGVNVNPVATIVTRHKLPSLECEIILGFPDCDSTSVDGYITSWLPMRFDIFPTTLDEFYALDWGQWSLFAPDYTESNSVGNSRGGGLLFPAHRDFDGDGLLARSFIGGNDPDDGTWDTDGDGVSDFREIELAAAGMRILPDDLDGDSDNDGIGDLGELRSNTRPDRFDSDADGLGDAAELNGALFTYNSGKQTLVRSNPLLRDSDADGLSDYSERQLHSADPVRFPYNPNGFNSFPMALHTDVDGPAAVRDGGNTFVSAGASFTYLTTLRNNLPADEFATGTLSVTLPSALGGNVVPYSIDYAGETERTFATTVIAGVSASGVATITNDMRALLRPEDETPRRNLLLSREASLIFPAPTSKIATLNLASTPGWATPFTSAVLEEKPRGEEEVDDNDLLPNLYRSNSSTIDRIAITRDGGSIEGLDLLGDNLNSGLRGTIDLACTTTGTCVAVYHKSVEDGSRNQGFETHRVVISSSGVASNPIMISVPNPNEEFENPQRNLNPAIASDGSAFMAAWLDSENGSNINALAIRPLNSAGNIPNQTGTTTPVAAVTLSAANEEIEDYALVALGPNTYHAAWVSGGGATLKRVTITNGVAGTTISQSISNYGGGLDLAARNSDGTTLITYRRSDGGVQAALLNQNSGICSVQTGGAITATAAAAAYSPAANAWLVGYSFDQTNGRLAVIPLDDTCSQLVSTQTAALDAPSLADGLDVACNDTACKAAIAGTPDTPDTPDTLFHYNIELSSTPAPYAALAQQIPDRLTIDSDNPTASFDNPRYYVQGGSSGIVHVTGTASDATSGVLRTTISSNGSPLGNAEGRGTWGFLYNHNGVEGVNTLAAQASDLVGRTQASPATTLVLVDSTAPVPSLDQAEGATLSTTYGAGDTFYRASLSGSASDPLIGSEAGSGVAGVEVRLSGGEWLPASLASNDSWQIDYPLPSFDATGTRLLDPSGSYVVNVRASDNVGNISGDEVISRTVTVVIATESTESRVSAAEATSESVRPTMIPPSVPSVSSVAQIPNQANETTPPAVAIATSAISLGLVLREQVQISGTGSDTSGVARVELRIGNGAWVDAQLTPQADGSVTWLALWPVSGPLPNSVAIQARATDTFGNKRTVTRTVQTDLLRPGAPALTPRYRASDGSLKTLVVGNTVSDAVTMQIDWAAASDNRSIAGYQAGWVTCLECDLAGQLTSYPASARSHSAAAPEPGERYAVVIARDSFGNEQISSAGPFFFDSPNTPDLVGDLDYAGWQNNPCAAVGVSYAVARRAQAGASVSEAQRLYASWDANNLHLAWHGADWSSAGDLALYLDSGAGGSPTGYDPEGRGPNSTLPNGFEADYLVRVEDSSNAILYQWQGSTWEAVAGWPSGQFRIDTRNQPARTDLVLPWASIGDPAGVGVIALALDEDSQAIWAVLPAANPLNSGRITGNEPSAGASLLQAFNWQRSDPCPAELATTGLDLQASLSSDPQGASAAFFADDLSGLQSPGTALDADSDGAIDADLGLAPGAMVGPGDTLSYTLELSNNGEQSADGLNVALTSFGALSISGPVSYTLETLEAGASTSLTFSGLVGSGDDSAELLITVKAADGTTLEWLWNHHPVDRAAPEPPVVLLREGTALLPGATVPVAASDPSGIGSVTLNGAACEQGSSNELWQCPAPESSGQIAATASDTRGNTSAAGPAVSIVIDQSAPTVAFDNSLNTALADGVLTPAELLLRGTASDDNFVAAVQLCASGATSVERCAETVPATESTATTWAVDLGLLSIDGEERSISATARDGAGRLSTSATFSATIDTLGPLVIVTTAEEGAFVGDDQPVLAGTISDGSGVASLEIEIQRIGGFAERTTATIIGGNWSFTPPASASAGEYIVRAYASDIYGNRRAYGPFPLRLTSDPIIAEAGGPYSVEELQGLTLDGTGTRVNGGTIASAGWDIDGNGSIDRDGLTVSAVLFNQAGVYEVALIATHSSGAVSRDTATVTVFNSQPVLNSMTGNSPVEGSAYTLDLTVSDPGNSGLYVTIDWGDGTGLERLGPFDGTGATSTLNLRHTYRDNGSYVVSFTIVDAIGAGVSDELTAIVNNAPPVLSLGDGETIGEGETLRRNGSFSDVGLADTHTATVDYGDGSGPQPLLLTGQTFELEQQYTRDGNYEVTVVVTDDDGGSVEGRFALQVENRGPNVSAGADRQIFEGETLELLASFSDPGVNDQHSASIDWGDGQVSNGQIITPANEIRASHVYTTPGRYSVVVSVTDEGGATGSASLEVTVLPGLLRYCVYALRNWPNHDVLELRPDAVVNCDIGARGSIELDKGSSVVGAVHSSFGRIRLERQSRASADLTAGTNVELEREAQVGGSITTLRDVLLKQRARVVGDVLAGNIVRRESGVQVGGSVTAFASGLVAPPASSAIAPPVVAGGAPVTIAPNGTLTLPPGEYGALNAGPGAILTLQAGEYRFSSIAMGNNSKLVLELSDATATLVVQVGGRLVLGNGHRSELTAGGEVRNVLFHVGGDRITLGAGGSYLGTFLGLGAEARLGQNATLSGALYGRMVFVENKARLNGDPAIGLVAEQP